MSYSTDFAGVGALRPLQPLQRLLRRLHRRCVVHKPQAGGRRGVAFGLLLGLAGAAWAQGTEPVVVAVEDDWPPYASAPAGGGAPQGFAVDLVREALASQGVSVRFVVMPFARCMFLARSGEVTGCFNATIVGDNRDAYVWHPTPMFHEELAIFARADATQRGLGLADLEGKRVGYTLGYTYPAEFRQNARIHKIGAKSDRVLIEMLQAGRVDYVLLNTAPAYLRLQAMGRSASAFAKVGVLSSDGFWLASTKAKPQGAELARQMELGLAALRASGRYEALQADLRRRIGQPVAAR